MDAVPATVAEHELPASQELQFDDVVGRQAAEADGCPWAHSRRGAWRHRHKVSDLALAQGHGASWGESSCSS